MKSILYILYFPLLFITACSDEDSAIPPQAEITNIYNVTDSSVNVEVIVSRQSNAEGQQTLELIIDSISESGNKMQFTKYPLTPAVNSYLKNSYTATISNLKNKTQYFIYLYFYGEFNLFGTALFENFDIGSPKTFTTQ